VTRSSDDPASNDPADKSLANESSADGGPAHDGAANGDADATAWLPGLLERYRQVLGRGDTNDPALTAAFNTLRLADALLDKRRLSAIDASHPAQIVLLGPTQAGKSTLVNVLLDSNAAGISALAGYTVHAIGLATGCEEHDLEPLERVMAPLQRVPAQQLDPAEVETFVLESVVAGNEALVRHAVVWDSPDFDSIAAMGYRGAVLQGAAIADVLVLVLSKDKYGDKSVWDMLALLRKLGKPIVICVNKLDPNDETTVLSALERRFDEQFSETAPPIVMIPFVRELEDTAPDLAGEVRRHLGQAIATAVHGIDRDQQSRAVDHYIAEHRAFWFEPLGHEFEAASEWRSLVAAALDTAEETYLRRYLDDPRKYDTFNRALAELLTLLELPGIARSLARARQLVTWPARTLLGVGRRQLGHAQAAAPDQEAEILTEILEQTLMQLQTTILERREDRPEQGVWWRALQSRLRTGRASLASEFEAEGEAVRKAFEPRIEAAAQRLHERLQTQPALLTTLRAARVTTDAAGIALAVKSGGLAPADLILAPAMLSVTTLLTEGALGRYLDTIRSELQNEQRRVVRRELIDAVLGDQLTRFANELDDSNLLSAGLDPSVERAITREATRPAS